MNCPDLEILSNYQDGVLDDAVSGTIREHLLSCPDCQHRFRMLGRVGLFFRMALGSARSTPCLDPEAVAAYAAGIASGSERKEIEEHLAGCDRCLHEVAVFSGEVFGKLTSASPVPTRRALAEFAKVGGPRRSPWRNVARAFVISGNWTLRAAAAVILAAMLVPLTWTAMQQAVVPEPAKPVVSAYAAPKPVEPTPTPGVESVSYGANAVAVRDRDPAADQPELAQFAREAGLLLRQIQDVAASPTEDRVGLLQEDVLNSGLVNTIEELTGEVRDARTRRFLADTQYVLLKVVRVNKADASRDLELIASEVRRLNLTEVARLIELEGGRSLWLAAL